MRLGFLLLALVAGAASAAPLEVGRDERLLVVAPHPDDEPLGVGGLVQRVLARDGTVRVVLVTAGDGYVEAVQAETCALRPRPADFVAYGEHRLGEARAAMRRLGGDRVRLSLLGFPDGGLDRLLRAHWWRTDSDRSTTTGASHPPYREALERNVAYDGDDLRRELLRLLRETQPTIVALPGPLDRHPDHRAAGRFTLMASTTGRARARPCRGCSPISSTGPAGRPAGKTTVRAIESARVRSSCRSIYRPATRRGAHWCCPSTKRSAKPTQWRRTRVSRR